MKLLGMIIIITHLTSISSKRYKHRSSESVENILYYRDCNHKQKTTTLAPVLRAVSEPQECKMCCTMCCGDDCVDCHKSQTGRQQGNIEPRVPQPGNIPSRERKRMKPPMPLIAPIPERRFSFTRENIKTLISKDPDIRKILKDLVKVTMQKVDLMKLINEKHKVQRRNMDVSADDSNSENDL